MLDGPNEGPPSPEGAKTWKDKFGLVNVSVFADPNFSMVSGGSVGTPMMTVIDPRTMQVTYVQQGFSGEFGEVESLAKQNAGAF
ncbi:MAG: hypothetical protein KC731_06375 [Myxococcales bacterium]|nr:hypothetical protein [Myxococcales bacterium]